MPAVPIAEDATGKFGIEDVGEPADRYRPPTETTAMTSAIVRRSSFLTRYPERP